MHTEVKCPMNIAEKAFYEIEMRRAMCVHKKTSLLDGVREVRASDREALESTREAAIIHGVVEEVTIGGGKLGTRVDECAYGMAITHTCPLEKLKSVLPLREKKSIGVTGDGAAKEV